MLRRKARQGGDDPRDPFRAWGCEGCADADPQRRSVHQLELARMDGLDGLRDHLTEQYVTLRDAERARPDVVSDICHWVATLMEQFSGMVDPTTGEPLSWWVARQYMMSQRDVIAHTAYAHAAPKYRLENPLPAVDGWASVAQGTTERLRREDVRYKPPEAKPHEQLHQLGNEEGP
jgi:hypothetical protein